MGVHTEKISRLAHEVCRDAEELQMLYEQYGNVFGDDAHEFIQRAAGALIGLDCLLEQSNNS